MISICSFDYTWSRWTSSGQTMALFWREKSHSSSPRLHRSIEEARFIESKNKNNEKAHSIMLHLWSRSYLAIFYRSWSIRWFTPSSCAFCFWFPVLPRWFCQLTCRHLQFEWSCSIVMHYFSLIVAALYSSGASSCIEDYEVEQMLWPGRLLLWDGSVWR